jgi:hypothetical protein
VSRAFGIAMILPRERVPVGQDAGETTRIDDEGSGGDVIVEAEWTRAVEAADDEVLQGTRLGTAERQQAVRRLLACQVRIGRNRGVFDLFGPDGPSVPRLYTGEAVRTKFAQRSVFSIEAARSLLVLAPEHPAVREAAALLSRWLKSACFVAHYCVLGECAASFVSYLRFLQQWQEGRGDSAQRLETVQSLRDGTGRWQRLPFYYTVLTLLDLPLESARAELRYALPALQRVHARSVKDPVYAARRGRLVERALSCADLRLVQVLTES